MPATANAPLRRSAPLKPLPGLGTPSRAAVGLAFAAIYLIWGSTYLAALVALETLPPYLMMAARLLVAGSLLAALARWRHPTASLRAGWTRNAASGVLILGLGSSSTVWAEQVLPSSLAAILATTVPLWLAVLDWPRWARYRREKLRLFGLLLGGLGVVGLFGKQLAAPAVLSPGYWLAVGAIVAGSLCTAAGSLLARYRAAPGPPLANAAVQLLAAGLFCGLVSAGAGEWTHFTLARVSFRSGWAVAYLVVFGSGIAYLAYLWLLQVRPPAVVGTYAYVNPVVAVLLGAGLAHEAITLPQVLALAIILLGVWLINRPTASPGPAETQP
ncbi:EamA family transporter [Hymenobacter chitinivorans]|uniref:Drug/metabolite transporter (DMT)-like permease n=1 Tax=Hymenobacter chitinivorans DSM 11115 TaxID=1121954 RepID=A0A2M9BNF2_9BACT|nr:EamA family transporter [Hymenobacter chitinivorans]PJJ59479.1 drug/metabolite transporter (DMT)-like permease [Hymenobacter chitinivorans DSM 11115]